MTIHDMQNLNRDTISYVATAIKPGMRLHDVRYICEEYMLAHGADSFLFFLSCWFVQFDILDFTSLLLK